MSIRGRLNDKEEAHKLADSLRKVTNEHKAVITNVTVEKRFKQRPLPLNTIEAQKLISRKLKISPHDAMSYMEKLYNEGYISYPRTET